MFKVGQKVVCIIDFIGIETRSFTTWTKTTRPIPIKGDVYTISRINHNGWLQLSEFKDSWNYDPAKFRPIDFSFGEKLAEEIQEEINQENLVNA